jgi:hypothetical protein
LLRTEGDPQAATQSIRIALKRLDKNLAPGLLLMNMERGPLHIQKSLAQIYAMYASVLAFLALILAGAGIYGAMAYLVSQRVAEIWHSHGVGRNGRECIERNRPRRPTAGVRGNPSWDDRRRRAFLDSTHYTRYDPSTFLGEAAFFFCVAGKTMWAPGHLSFASA